jgi:hypothetical protein
MRARFFPQTGIAGNFQHGSGKQDLVEGTDGFHRAAGWGSGGRFPGEGAEFQEKLFPAADNDLASLDLAECEAAAELGGERLVVGEEEHALAVVPVGVTECQLQGVPSHESHALRV